MPAIFDAGVMSDAESNASEQSIKRRRSPSMTSLKKAQAEIGSNMVPVRHLGKEKKIPSNRKIQQKFSKLLTNAFKKS